MGDGAFEVGGAVLGDGDGVGEGDAAVLVPP
jgi:hypothetical protein